MEAVESRSEFCADLTFGFFGSVVGGGRVLCCLSGFDKAGKDQAPRGAAVSYHHKNPCGVA